MNRRLSSPIPTERRFQLLVEAITDYAIYMLDPQGRIESWNPGAERIKGYSADEVLGRHFSLFFTDEDKARGLPDVALREAAACGRFESESWRIRKDGSRFWAVAVVDAIRDEDGALIGFAKVTRDITERRAAREALRASEKRFRLLVDGAIDYAIYMLDPQGRIESWNAGAERIKQYRADEIVGKHFSSFYTEEDRAAGVPAQALRRAAEEGRYEAEGWRVRKDGTRFWASVVIDAIRDTQGALIGFAKVTRDITERREAQLKLEEAQAQLVQAQKMEAIGQLTGGVAHDFNNLLTIVLGGAETALRHTSDERVRRVLRNIQDAAERGASLTQQLLAFSRRQTLRPEVVAVDRLLAGAAELLRRSLRADVTVEVEVAPNLPPVKVDPRQLELSLLNLGLNARDAMPSGGRIAIRASLAPATGDAEGARRVAIEVADTGTGMVEAVRQRATEPFFTTKEVGKGSGLGLSQASGFALQSGGSLSIDSEPGRGTTVTLLLPASAEAPPDPKRSAPIAAGGAPRTILLVEDEAAVASIAEQMLSDMGHSVRIASDAIGALRILEDEPVELVFSDIVMPGGMDGLELARALRSIRPDMPVLLATGYADAMPTEGGPQEFPVIRKPYAAQDIARAIELLIKRE